MKYEFPRWKALIPTLLPVPPLVISVVTPELWTAAVFILSIAVSIELGSLWCSCPGCGAAMLVRGGLSPFGSTYICRHCGGEIRLK